jgi:cobalt-zinc-cadmium efflux system outer membrane protein
LLVLDHFHRELSSLLLTVDAIEAAGEIAPVNARLFALERATRAAQQAGTRGDVERFRARVHRLLGVDQRRPIDLVPGVVLRAETSESDGESWPSIAHPEALLAEAEHAGAERSLALEVTKQYPDIVIGPGFGREDGNDRVILGFSIPIPLFNRNQQAIGVARAERDAARVAYEATLERLDADLAEAHIDLIASRTERRMLEVEVAPIADNQHDEALRIAELGEVDTLLLLESLKRRFDARLAVLDALRAESIASIRMEAAIGPPKPGAASEENRP